MRAASRLFAAVKPGQYLEAGNPTGLTGLLTHASPRSTLLYLYSSTLDKLAQIPESSVYRQSTEALTKHRLAVVEGVKPPGHDAWAQKVQYMYSEHPEAFDAKQTSKGVNIEVAPKEEVDPREAGAAWDGELRSPTLEGIRSQRARRTQSKLMGGGPTFKPEAILDKPTLDAEPQLTAEQISDIESRIGAGLIEEVIQVAEGEHKLVDEMIKSKAWEPLEEPAPAGQWSYFERGGHTKTQKP
ncbi:NADH-ubiquinone oxidoreductase 29.9 kd subunit precursor [Lophiotrema nucula]|uniref:NADH-ubiquinone oxidoreductase 29.9 kd subunit n=1 Tax=Lophiotrema nucula TaxID=690887 RepID=A0A6A5Z381_9PLEO|nr:NADH-ubiquinone oxidoreductase 29.9 kd subunit precursor [Lophiotrema nucula]